MARLMLLLLVVAPMILISYAGSAQKGYIFKVSKDIYERVKVDTRKKSETFNLQQASSGKAVGDIIFDFKKNLTMIRLPKARSCFLKDSIGDIPRPAALQKLLQLASRSANQVKLTKRSVEQLRVVGKLNDRSVLSSEMADLCANLPIHRVTVGDVNQNDMDQMEEEDEELDVDQEPVKRGLPNPDKEIVDTVNKETKRYICRNVCVWGCISIPSGVSCGWSGCSVRYRKVCSRVCARVCT